MGRRMERLMETYKEHMKQISFRVVEKNIETSKWIHFHNNSINNLINNFSNIYKCRDSTNKLRTLYNEKLKTFEK